MRHFLTACMAVLTLAACCNDGEVDFSELNAQAGSEYLEPVRPGYEGRQPYWNEFATKFIYAPAFDFKEVAGAEEYCYKVYWKDDKWTKPVQGRPYDEMPPAEEVLARIPADAVLYSFKADKPNLSLSPVWNDVPAGNVTLVVEGVTKEGKSYGIAGVREFLRDFPFCGPYNDAVRDYTEAAILASLFVHKMPAVQSWKDSTEPDMSYAHNTYPCKIIGGTIKLEVRLAQLDPSRKEECLAIARNAAAFLMSAAQKEGPLAHFPPTYYKGLVASAREENQGTTMMIEASNAAQAYLDLYDFTGEKVYYDEALAIADSYMGLQREDGSFAIKVNWETGEPVNNACALLHPILNFLQRLHNDYGIDKYIDMQSKAEAWMDEVAMETFDMTGQFEDVTVLGWHPYQNLTNCTAAPYASYLLNKSTVSEKDLENALDLIRLSEDQFVHWDALRDEDGIRPIVTPCVYEQYQYRTPVDNSSCNVANALLDYYEVTGDRLAFEKAKALIDNLTVVQNPVNGQILTTWDVRSFDRDKNRSFWINCSNASIQILVRMAEYEQSIQD